MAIERWRPFEAFRELEQRMEDLMRYPVSVLRRPLLGWRVPTEGLAWTPALEMYEKSDKFIVRLEVPGLKKEDIDISFTGDTLTVTGERKIESEVKDEDYYSCEFSYGKFSRSLTIPSGVKAEKVEASYENGILEITLPKAEEAKPKKVEIKGSGK
jgi:HSP20 family protein